MPGFLFYSNLHHIRKFDLVGIEFHPRMIHVELLNFFYTRLLVIDKYLKVNAAEQIQVYLVAIVADGHDKCPIFIKKTNLF